MLKNISDKDLCITRKKWGCGYVYLDQKGNKISDTSILKRIKKLAIPPMWSNVLICECEDGHIQAVGRDTKDRKQYIYHPIWEQKRQDEKFKKMIDFGKNLPKIRSKCNEILNQTQSWTWDKSLALVVSILDHTGIRVGNQQYLNRNGTYGLTTLRNKHLSTHNGDLVFEYMGKSRKKREVKVDDDELIKFIEESAEKPGYELFRYKSDNKWLNVDSEDVNEFIHNYMSKEFSSKDFRTWAATRLAVSKYKEAFMLYKKKKSHKFINILVRLVANELGNTPSVCKSYYIHPQIIAAAKIHQFDNVNLKHLRKHFLEEEEIVMRVLENKL